MVRTQQIANLLNGKLNTIAAAKGVNKQFKLKAHLGKTDGGNIINGILKPTTGTPYEKGGTGSGTNGAVVTYVASLVFPTSIDNSFATIVEDIVATLIEQEHGGSFTINGGKAVWEMTYGVPEGFDIRDVVGSSMPISFTVKVSFASTGLLNGIKAWTLDGHPIPYVQEAVILNRYGKTISIDEARDQQTIPTAQAKQFKFTIPYDSSNVVCTTLKNDILLGAFTKTYQLNYNDGAVQFSKTVTLYANGDTGTNGTGENTMLTVSFVEAGGNEFVDADGNTIRYQIALVNWDFSDTSENTLYFASQSAQQTFMVDLATDNASSDWMPFNAPSLNNVLETTVEVQKDDANIPDKVLDYNYAIIQRTTTDTEDVSTSEYSYYFVSQATAGAFGMVSLALKMDTIQTYLFNPNIEFADCMIERACLNRWIDNGDGTVSFDGTPTSKLFEREPIQNFAKRLKLSKDFALVPNNYDAFNPFITEPVSEFFDDYVQAWAYVYLDANVNLGQHSTQDNPCLVELRASNDNDGSLAMPYIVLCYPIMMNGGVINVLTHQGTQSGDTAISKRWDFKDFVGTSISASILNIKFSQESPFPKFNTFDQFSFAVTSTGVLTITNGKTSEWEKGDWGAFNILANIGVDGTLMTYIVYKHQLNSMIGGNLSYGVNWRSFDLYDDFNIRTKFYKYNIIGQNKNIEFNPKLLTSDYTELKLGQGLGEPYSYEILKFCKTYPTLSCVWSESLTPTTNKAYLALYENTTTGGIYNETTASHYVGASITQDLTFPYTVSQLQQFLAQNKNFFLQSVLGTAQGVMNGPIGGAIAGATAGKSPQNVTGAITGAAIGTGVSMISQALSMDNMKNSPLSYKALSGDPALGLSLNGGRSYVQVWQALPYELEMANNFMFVNGFTYSQLDNPLNYIHTRKYFDYIKADITDILGLPLSNIIRADIQQRFSNGLRFWNVDTYQQYGLQYEKENYELWLEG